MTSDRRKRVALVVNGAGWAGTERHVRSLVECLPERGFDVHLITSQDGPLQEQAQSAGASVHQVPRRSTIGYGRGLFGLLRELRPDVIHAHSGRVPLWVARLAGVPRIIDTRHGLLERLNPRLQNLGWRWRWEVLKCRAAHQTVTVAKADRSWLIRAGLPAGRVTTVYNGVPEISGQMGRPSQLTGSGPGVGPSQPARHDSANAAGLDIGFDPERPTPIRLGLVGRLAPQKAPERAIDLMRYLKQNSTISFELVIYGDGELEGSTLERARDAGVEKSLTWGGVTHDVLSRLRELDLLLLPSRAEGIPYVLLESLAVGLPVLSTPVGGIPEVLAGAPLNENVLAWEVEPWAERVVESTSPGFRERWAEAAALKMEDFGERSMISRIVEIYEGRTN